MWPCCQLFSLTQTSHPTSTKTSHEALSTTSRPPQPSGSPPWRPSTSLAYFLPLPNTHKSQTSASFAQRPPRSQVSMRPAVPHAPTHPQQHRQHRPTTSPALTVPGKSCHSYERHEELITREQRGQGLAFTGGRARGEGMESDLSPELHRRAPKASRDSPTPRGVGRPHGCLRKSPAAERQALLTCPLSWHAPLGASVQQPAGA